VDGYENGTMTFTVSDGQNTQSATYTAENGTRSTINQISETQYAFAQFDNTYWYDSTATGHGVCVDAIPYQEEQSVEIVPVVVTETPKKSSSSKSSSKSSKSSSSTAASSQASESASSTTEQSSGDDVDWAALILGGAQLAKNIYDLFS
jgi:hypothetical protein